MKVAGYRVGREIKPGSVPDEAGSIIWGRIVIDAGENCGLHGGEGA